VFANIKIKSLYVPHILRTFKADCVAGHPIAMELFSAYNCPLCICYYGNCRQRVVWWIHKQSNTDIASVCAHQSLWCCTELGNKSGHCIIRNFYLWTFTSATGGYCGLAVYFLSCKQLLQPVCKDIS